MSKIKNCILYCSAMLALPTMLYADNLAVVGQAFLLFIGIITFLSLAAAAEVPFLILSGISGSLKSGITTSIIVFSGLLLISEGI